MKKFNISLLSFIAFFIFVFGFTPEKLWGQNVTLYSGLKMKVKDFSKDNTLLFKPDAGLSLCQNFKAGPSYSLVCSWGRDYSACNIKRYGLMVNPSLSSWPFYLKACGGGLSFSGLINSLKSPFLLPGSALKKSCGYSSSVSANLPSFTSSKKEDAFFISAGGKNYLPEIQFAAVKNGEVFAGLSKDIRLNPLFLLSLYLAGGNFYYGKEPGRAWFSKEAFYTKDLYSSAALSLTVKSPAVRGSFTFASSQNPFGSAFYWTRDSCIFNFGAFNISTSLFIADPDLITASGRKGGARMQFSVNPQYTGLFSIAKKNCLWQTGLVFQRDFYDDSDKFHVRCDSVFDFGKRAFSFMAGLCYTFSLEGDEKINKSVSLSFTEKYDLLLFRGKLKGTFNEDQMSFTFSPSFSFKSFPMNLCSLSITGDFLEGKFDRLKFGSSFYFNVSKKYFNFRGNLSFNCSYTY